jgi:two-component system, OmpR family, sensor histidine kinase KdpD
MDGRPDPDKLLKSIQAEEAGRGKLKIFFGACPGVGKTYSMLEAARAKKKEGVDVIAGYVEAHKRPETQLLLDGLEVLPAKEIPYRNVVLKEFDVDAALKRKPSLILVDELAHTNAPGSRHPKRWQDVEELLNSGIDVYTTLNVQHCESVNDVVAQVTGVLIRETVSDTFIETADEITLVDLPPEDLLKRLKEGKVYLGDQAERAAENFFQPGNLIALRQLALRYTARNVDAKMRSYKETHAISKVWNVGERFLVCISPSPSAMRLIRAAKRIASEIGAPWVVCYVEIPSAIRRSEADKNRLSEMLRFAEKLGADTAALMGQNISDEVISYARSKNISKIVVGKPERTRWQEFFFGSVVNQLARKCGEIDLYVISGERGERLPEAKRSLQKSFSWTGMGFAVLTVAFITGLNLFLFRYLSIANLIMIYLLGVVWVAYRYGRRVSIAASFLSVICFDFFFVPPYFSFAVSDTEYAITFLVMLAIGILISDITGRLRQQTFAIRVREERTQALYALSRDLAKTSDPAALYETAVHHVAEFFKCPVIVFTRNEKNALTVKAEEAGQALLNPNEKAVVEWAYGHKKIAGKDTETLPGSSGLYLPLNGSEKIVGVLGIFPKESQFLDPDSMHMLQMFVKQAALAVEGAESASEALKAEAQMENERLKNLLLTTFSYDLPKQFSEISNAADDLLKPEIMNDGKKRQALIRKIKIDADRLTDLAKELPGIVGAG